MKTMGATLISLGVLIANHPDELPTPESVDVRNPELFEVPVHLSMASIADVARWAQHVGKPVEFGFTGDIGSVTAVAKVATRFGFANTTVEARKHLSFPEMHRLLQRIDEEIVPELGVQLPPETVLSEVDVTEHVD